MYISVSTQRVLEKVYKNEDKWTTPSLQGFLWDLISILFPLLKTFF